jgi:pyruvate dehydrogenase E2 component (dihydrolipoamide acetyltransferase)
MQLLRTPPLPDSAAPASLVRWLVSPGRRVRAGQTLVLLAGDSELLAIQAPEAGVVGDLQARPGETVKKGDALVEIDSHTGSGAAQDGKNQEDTPAMSEANDTPAPDTETSDVTPLLLPQVGNSMEEGTILKWHVAEGDRIEPGQVLYEMETDKATVEVEAEQAGRLASILIKEDQTAPVKTPVAYLAESDQALQDYLSRAGEENLSAHDPKEDQAPAEAETGERSSGPSGPVEPILMPQVGNSMEEGTIVKWHVKPGDEIENGQVIFEVETDKATVEVEADQAGRLGRIVLDEGQTLAVKQPVAYLADNDEDVDAYLATSGAQAAFDEAAPPRESPPAPEQPKQPAGQPVEQQPTPGPAGHRVKASPAARKLAAQRGIDLSTLPAGSGPGGRILSEDLPEGAAAPSAAPTVAAPQPAGLGQTQQTKLTRMRKAIGNALQASKQNIPHFYMRLSIDADPMMDFYRRSKQQFKLSVNDVIAKACSIALAEFPAFRSRVEDDQLITAGTVNIGIAVGMDEGLVVPVVKGVEKLDLSSLAAETRRVVQAARGGKVEGMGAGCFTISNLGMFGVEEFSAIINPPESAILAVGGIREEVIVRDGAMRPGRKMNMTLSCDHRVVDGLAAAKFCARLKEILESPGEILSTGALA